MAKSKVKARRKLDFSSEQTKEREDGNIQVIKDDKRIEAMIEGALNNGCLLWFDCGKWGNRRQLADDLLTEAMASVGVSQDTVRKKIVRASQDLLDRGEIESISVWIHKAHRWARQHSLPWMTSGVHWIHKDKVDEGDQFILSCRTGMRESLEEFLEDKYDAAREKFKSENPKLYDEKYYPTKDQMRHLFRLRYGFVPIAKPSEGTTISVLSKDRLIEEDRKFKERMKEVIEQSIMFIRTSFAEMVSHLDRILEPDKKFQERAIDKVQGYLEEFFVSMNVYGDNSFSDIAKELKNKLHGITAEEIRTDADFRQKLKTSVESIKLKFEKLPQIKLERDIDIDF